MAINKLAKLALEDGSIYTGRSFGADVETSFELVFNTSMTGYQEIISDPSYNGQGVLFTVPHIGNVGINIEDMESATPRVSAVIVRALSPIASNWRATEDLDSWCARNGVPGISNIDTRSLTRKLRDQGSMKAVLSSKNKSDEELIEQAKNWHGLDGLDMVSSITSKGSYQWGGDEADRWLRDKDEPTKRDLKVVLIDYGAKRNILRHLRANCCEVTVVPATYSATQILDLAPNGVMLSSGPGDPSALPYAVDTAKYLIRSGIPMFGICLGHQIIGLALGGRTGRLKFGHHGGNHPVQDMVTSKVYITAQNHNYMVLEDSVDPNHVQITHRSLNDGSIEGLRIKDAPVYSVQFHPEAAPGPHDAHEIFQPFITAMREMIHG